jgi:hypothetical protein
VRAARGCCGCLALLVALAFAWFLYTSVRLNAERFGGLSGAAATVQAERTATAPAATATPAAPFARTPPGIGPTPTTAVVVKVVTPAR